MSIKLPILILLLLHPIGACGAELLIKDGKSQAEIVVEEDAPRTVQMAAKELQTYLRKSTGVEIVISGHPTPEWPIHIYVGKSPYTKKLGVRDTPLKHGAFRLVSGDKWLAFIGEDRDFEPREPWAHHADDQGRMLQEWDRITGETFGNPYARLWRRLDRKTGLWEFDLDNAGTFNAVNKFLRDLGVRWYAPGELGEVVPSLKSVELPKVDETVIPDFALRNFYIYGGNFALGDKDLLLWQMRLGLNQGMGVFGCAPDTAFCHGIEPVLAREEMKQAHADFYKLEQSERQTKRGIPCLSSEELLQANVRYLRALFDHYDIKVVSVMPTDGFLSLCQCEKCKGKATLKRGLNGQLSDYVWDYVDRVAKELLKSHPDRKIQCAAYSSYLLPPEKINKLSPNILVGIATGMDKNSTVYQDILRDWQSKLDPEAQIYQYDYYIHDAKPNTPFSGVPVLFPKTIANNIRSLNGKSLGEYIEVSPNIVNDINVYVASRFLWKADQSLPEMMDEYYGLFYGPAKMEMKAFFEFCEANYGKMPDNIADIDAAFDLIAKAKNAAGDTIYAKRIDNIVSFMQPMKKTRERLATAHQNAPKFNGANRDGASVVLNGKLDKPFWQDIPSYPLVPVESHEKTQVSTLVKIAWKGSALYFGIYCQEPNMKNLGKGVTKNGDMAIWDSDNVEIFLESQYRSYYQITVNPSAAFTNVDWTEKTLNSLWMSGVEVATYRGADFWSVEVRVPVAEGKIDIMNGVMGERPTAKSPWFFNVGRQRLTAGAKEIFSISGGKFHDTLNYGKLVIQ